MKKLLLSILSLFFITNIIVAQTNISVDINDPVYEILRSAENQNLCSTLFIDGAIHGFAGFIAVVGTYFACYKGFANSMGWNALTCALLAGKNPLFVIPSGLFLSWLYTSASRFSLVNNFGFDMSGIIQGVVVFAVAGNIAFTKLWRKK